MLDQEESAFSFFMDLGQFLVQRGLRLLPQSPEDRCTNLKDFYLTRHPDRAGQLPLLHDLCLFDLCLHGRPRKLPDWVSTAHNLPFQKQLQELLHSDERLGELLCDPVEEGSKQLAKSLHPQVFCLRPAHRLRRSGRSAVRLPAPRSSGGSALCGDQRRNFLSK